MATAIANKEWKKGDGFVNFTMKIVNLKNHEDIVLKNNEKPVFPLYLDKAVHEFIIDNHEKLIAGGHIVIEVDSIGFPTDSGKAKADLKKIKF